MKNLLISNLEMLEESMILYKAKKHWISFVLPAMGSLVGCIGAVFTFFGAGSVRIIGLALLAVGFKGLMALLNIMTTKIYLTSEYLTITQSLFTNSVTDIPLNKLEGVVLTQGFLGRIFNFGKLTVWTRGVWQSYTIKNPMELRSKIINP